jgi:DNA (cytosine-5)-methyltransferase 1
LNKPYAIENVIGAPLKTPTMLCGTMFGLKVYRHRLFECSVLVMTPEHRRHEESTGSHRGYSRRHPFVCVAGHNFNRQEAEAAMGIDWMTSRAQLAQAIPPAYTQFIGRQLMAVLESTQPTKG